MKFDPYEYIAVIVPGTVFLVAMSLIFESIVPFFDGSISIGDFGISLIIAFVCGHLLQAIGNILEDGIWWAFGGWPTSVITNNKTNLIDRSQFKILEELVSGKFNAKLSDKKENKNLSRLIYSYVKNKGKVEQIDIFNRNYGLMRGIFTSLLVSGLIYALYSVIDWKVLTLIICASCLALFRMIRFAKYYAKQLYIEFIAINLE